MFTDFGITGVWASSPSDFRDEFKKAFNDDTEDTSDGLHTYVFCRYHDNSVYAEVLYVVVLDKLVFFCLSTAQYQMVMDNTFTVISFNVLDDSSYIFPNTLFVASDVEYVGDSCDCMGNSYRVFLLNNQDIISKVTDKYGSDFPVECITTLSNDDVAMMCSEFMTNKSVEFTNQIHKAIQSGELPEGFDENPYQDAFYDRNLENNV